MIGILGFIVGAVFGGIVNSFVKRYSDFKESKGIAFALQAEIAAVLRLVQFRNYIGLTDAIIVRLRDPSHVLDANDVFLIRITQDYFSVFHAVSPKIGLLGRLSSEVVLVYAAGKSLLEDIAQLRERGEPFVEGTKTATPEQLRAFFLRMTEEINRLFRETVTIATNTANSLGVYSNRRWFYIFK